MRRELFLCASIAVAGACASYRVPGRGADFALFAPRSAAPQPAAQFPATLALVRVQASGYDSLSVHRRAGDGRYSIVTVRDVEQAEDFERLAKLPQVRALVSFNRTAIAGELIGGDELRRIGAELQADLVLAYTLDTLFQSNKGGPPLQSVPLAASTTRVAAIESTASAIVLDTRTGFVYGRASASETQAAPISPWWKETAIDEFRRGVERAAFHALIARLEETWSTLVPAAASAPAAPR
jgi:hypothetical protein